MTRCVLAVVPGGLHGPGGISRMARHIAESWADDLPPLRVLDSTGARKGWRSLPAFLRAAACIAWHAARRRIALLHLHMAEGGSLLRKGVLLLLARAFGIPVVLHLHGARFADDCTAMPPLARRATAALLRQANLVLTLGSHSRAFMVTTLALPPARVAVLPNGVQIPPAPAPMPNACDILFLGTLCERKGLDVLLLALADPALRRHPWRLTVAGDGDLDPWRRRAAALGLQARVHFAGWVDAATTGRLLEQSALLVLPSRQEGLPLAVLEAMAYGRAVIATPVGDVTDAITDGATGLLVPPGHAGALARALGRMIQHPGLRASTAAAARLRAQERFDLRITAPALAALLRPLLHRPARDWRSVAALGGGAAGGQALALLAAPLLTRLYPAEAFGLFGLFSGLVAALGAVAALKFDQAVVLDPTPRAAAVTMRLCALSAAAVALACAAGLAATAWAGGPALRIMALALLPWVPAAVLGQGLALALAAWALRQRAFARIGGYHFTRTALAVALQLLAALLLPPAGWLLVAGQTLGQMGATLALAHGLGRRLAPLRRPAPSRRLAAAVVHHRAFPLFGAPQTLLHTLALALPALLLPLSAGATQAGLAWLAWRLLVLPNIIIVDSLRAVLFRRAAALHAAGAGLAPPLRRAGLLLALACLPVPLLLAAWGPALFALVFGEAWRGAGTYAALLALPWWLENIAVPASVLVSVLRLQRAYLAIELASLAARATALLAGGHLGGPLAALALYAAAGCASSLALILLAEGALRRRAPAALAELAA